MISPQGGPSLRQPSHPRFLFVDRLRGWAVIIMIETHVVNALLATSLRHEWPHAVLNFINGLVAPSFLFCAGFAYAIASARKWVDYKSIGPAARSYVQRLLFILMVAYSLHLPAFSFSRLRALMDPEAWISFFQVDILQTIAVSLLILLAGTALLRTKRVHRIVFLGITVLVLFLTPLVNHGRYAWLPTPLGGFISHDYASQFPLFPWAVFLFSGYLIGSFYIEHQETDKGRWMKQISLIGGALIAVSLIAAIIPVSIYPGLPFWGDSPQFVLLRVGIVMLLMAFFYLFEGKNPAPAIGNRPPGIPLLFGRESLLVYTLHLLMVYGQDYQWSMQRTFGESLSYLHCFGIFLFVTLAMYLTAWGWRWLKDNNLVWAKRVQYAVVAAAAIQFFLAP